MGKITNEALLQKITDRFADQILSPEQPYGLLTFAGARNRITQLSQTD